ncbi:hypothetical protein BROUX41_001321 [Berkeleyomyces rouxiae]|uniref:uncharacterized protein n=1 Tax=Berkeleyomyces rouxiae TaxID=2035830 RepID=UPI003B77CD45
MQALFRSRPALQLGSSRGLALPARVVSHQRLTLPRRPDGNGRLASTPPLRVSDRLRAAYDQCRCYNNSATFSAAVTAGIPAQSTGQSNDDFWESYENVYDTSLRKKDFSKKPRIRRSDHSDKDSAGNETESLLVNKGNSRSRRAGRWRHQVVATIKGHTGWSKSFIPFFDYKEWGWLRHQIPPENIPKMRKMHRRWKEHCQQVRTGRWETTFYPTTEAFPGCNSADEMAALWDEIGLDEDLSVWRPVILSLSATAPGKGAMFLEATTRGEWWPPGYMISDILRLEAQRLADIKDTQQRKTAANKLLAIAIAVISRLPKQFSPFRQHDFFLLQREATNDKALEFYMMLLEKEIPVHPNTMAQFAYRFALQNSYKPYAMRIIYEALTNIPGVNKMSSWAKVCTTLFLPGRVKETHESRGDPKHDVDTGEMAQELWASLIPAGFSPNLIHFTALIRYLSLHGHMDTAWKVFEVVVEHDIQPDPVLYATLLDGAKKRLDLDSFQRSLALISTDNTATVATWNTALHYVLSLGIAEAYQKKLSYPRVIPTFAPLLEIYRRVFRIEPLEKLLPDGFSRVRPAADLHDWRFAQDLLHPIHNALPELREDEKLEPSTATLVIMMISYLKNAAMSYDVMAFYTRFRGLLMSGDEMAAALVREQGTVVYDMVIKAFAGWPGLLRASVDVLNDMMPGSSVGGAVTSAPATVPHAAVDQKTSAHDEKTSHNSTSSLDATSESTELVDKPTPRHPPPSVYTWNILLHSWVMQRSDNTDQVLQLMEEHGVKPILVSWNTLISGYARAQHAQQVSETLVKLHQSGFVPDEWTLRAFGRLRDKDTVLMALRQALNEETGKEMEGRLDGDKVQARMNGL